MKTLRHTFLAAGFFLILFLMQGGLAHAQYAWEQQGLRYNSLNAYDTPGTFILKRDMPTGTAGSGIPQGDYLIEDYSQSGWDKTFDYNSETKTFTIYDGRGPSEELHFLGAGQLIVKELLPENSDASGIYEEDGAGIYRYGSHAIPHYITDAMTYFLENGEGVTFSSTVPGNGSWRNFSVHRNTRRTSSSNEPRYILVDANNSHEWVAFTYDDSNGVFTMYDPNSGDEPYAYRRFRPDGTLESNDLRHSGQTLIYIRQGDGNYYNDYTLSYIYKYVTDGMRLFLDNID